MSYKKSTTTGIGSSHFGNGSTRLQRPQPRNRDALDRLDRLIVELEAEDDWNEDSSVTVNVHPPPATKPSGKPVPPPAVSPVHPSVSPVPSSVPSGGSKTAKLIAGIVAILTAIGTLIEAFRR